MAKVEIPSRTKQDALWRMAQGLSVAAFASLKAHARTIKKDRDKVELIAWYREKLPEYDRDLEKKKYPSEEQFKKLKSRSLTFLISFLATEGAYPHADLDRGISEIKVQVALDHVPEVLHAIADAKEICRQRERFQPLIELLHLEAAVIPRAFDGEDRLRYLLQVQGELRDARKRAEDLERWMDMALRHRYPLMARLQHDGKWDEYAAKAFLQELDQVREEDCLGRRSLAEYHRNYIYLLTRSINQYDLVIPHWERFLAAEAGGFMVAEEPEAYSTMVLRIMAFACEKRDLPMARKAFVELEQLSGSSEVMEATSLNRIVLGYFFFEEYFGDQAAGKRACELFYANRAKLKNRLREIEKLWIFYYISRHFLLCGKFQECEGAIDEFFALRPSLKEDLQVILRTWKVICRYFLVPSYHGFGKTTKAALTYIASKEVYAAVAIEVVRGIEALAMAQGDAIAMRRAWEESFSTLSDFYHLGQYSAIFGQFDFLEYWRKGQESLLSRL